MKCKETDSNFEGKKTSSALKIVSERKQVQKECN